MYPLSGQCLFCISFLSQGHQVTRKGGGEAKQNKEKQKQKGKRSKRSESEAKEAKTQNEANIRRKKIRYFDFLHFRFGTMRKL